MNIKINQECHDQIQSICSECTEQGKETTFYLVGREEQQDFIITNILRAGQPIEGAVSTQPDYSASAKELSLFIQQGLTVRGEGHVHPFKMPDPSSGDIGTLKRIAMDGFTNYLCMVASLGPEKQLVLRCISFDGKDVQEHPVTVMQEKPTMQPEPRADQEYQPFIPRRDLNINMLLCGLGSGGCNTALMLGKIDVKQLVLLDNDKFVKHNFNRHLADNYASGQYKAMYMKDFLQHRTRKTKIHALTTKIEPSNQEELLMYLTEADLIINCTGHPVASNLLSDMCRQLHKPCIHAATFAKGSGGLVFVQSAEAPEPCYNCLFRLTRTTQCIDNESMKDLEKQYGFTKAQLEHQAGLWIDVNLISSLHSKVVLEFIKSRLKLPEGVPNLYILDNQALEVHKVRLQQDPQCTTCFPPDYKALAANFPAQFQHPQEV